jgi:uncharacterized membrane protein YfcA
MSKAWYCSAGILAGCIWGALLSRQFGDRDVELAVATIGLLFAVWSVAAWFGERAGRRDRR